MQKPQISDGSVHDLITGSACCLSEYFKTGNCMKTEFQKKNHYHRQSRLKAENIAIFEEASNHFFSKRIQTELNYLRGLCVVKKCLFNVDFDLEVGKYADMTISPFLAYVRNISKLHR